jgi:hypothetical protein
VPARLSSCRCPPQSRRPLPVARRSRVRFLTIFHSGTRWKRRSGPSPSGSTNRQAPRCQHGPRRSALLFPRHDGGAECRPRLASSAVPTAFTLGMSQDRRSGAAPPTRSRRSSGAPCRGAIPSGFVIGKWPSGPLASGTDAPALTVASAEREDVTGGRNARRPIRWRCPTNGERL